MIHEDFFNKLEKELSNDLYDSKDWKTSDYIGKIRWLKIQLEGKNNEIDHYLELASEDFEKDN